ncbi:hypothetical protein DM01DRAFT_1307662 [Hesseltinella vesiculosa]|uniref:SPX domain-containing protein n=1 Tax=Hesseltinella vesiculosa TaxID=101127 RepID=A0A1X2GDD7_9FUNG|nr:hypothetical protein DM01DRAFT_1307662 [Hesseltinella vesiculosa]
MKYGRHLQEKMNPSWRIYYMDYEQFKVMLKSHSQVWTNEHEATFKQLLGKEISKVCGFLRDRITRSVDVMRQLEQEHQRMPQQKRANDEIEKQVIDTIFYVYDTAQFLLVNKMGFDKIVKKHDRYTQYNLQTQYTRAKDPITQSSNQLDALFIWLAQLADQHHHRKKRQDESTTASQARNRQYLKMPLNAATFWIHPDNIDEVRTLLFLHLPPLDGKGSNRNARGSLEKLREAYSFTDVYWDNDDLTLYNKHVTLCNQKTRSLSLNNSCDTEHVLANTHLLKYTWNGHHPEAIQFERLTKTKAGGGAIMQAGNVDQDTFTRFTQEHEHFFQASTAPPWQRVAFVDSKLSEHDALEMQQINTCISQGSLEPKCKVIGQRYLFENEGVLAQLDLEMVMSRARRDAQVKDEPFPYGQLTIHHAQGHHQLPGWLQLLMQSHLVYSVDRFSMFAHTVSQVYRTSRHSLNTLPWWIYLLGHDIHKPVTGKKAVGLTRNAAMEPLIDGHRPVSFDEIHQAAPAPDTIKLSQRATFKKPAYVAVPLIDTSVCAPVTIAPNTTTAASPGSSWFTTVWRQQRYHQQRLASTTSSAMMQSNPYHQHLVMPPPSAAISIHSTLGRGRAHKDNNPKLTEPKTYFANERTFITWLQFTGLLLMISLSLLNGKDQLSHRMGILLIVVTMISTGYSLMRFQYRSWQLRKQNYTVRYDDVTGPTCLCILLIMSTAINFYFRIIYTSAE